MYIDESIIFFYFATALLTLLASSALVFTSAQTFPPRDTVQYSSGTISSIQDDEAGNQSGSLPEIGKEIFLLH